MGAMNPGRHSASTYRMLKKWSQGVNVEADFSGIVDGIRGMDPAEHKEEIRGIIFDGLGKVRSQVVDEVNQRIPYRRYPTKHNRRDYHQHGELRGKQYGDLSNAVKRSVSSDISGGSVNIYSKRNEPNRWCVLQWLNDGTLTRQTGGRTRIKVDKRGRASARFVAHNDAVTPGNRGFIEAQNFFMPAAGRGVRQAEGYILTTTKKLLEDQLK